MIVRESFLEVLLSDTNMQQMSKKEMGSFVEKLQKECASFTNEAMSWLDFKRI